MTILLIAYITARITLHLNSLPLFIYSLSSHKRLSCGVFFSLKAHIREKRPGTQFKCNFLIPLQGILQNLLLLLPPEAQVSIRRGVHQTGKRRNKGGFRAS